MQNEGTRGDVAQNFREQGNEAAKEKRWVDAKEFYSKSIAVLQAKANQWDKPEDPREEEKLLRQVEEASFINRALCNLELSEWVSYLAIAFANLPRKLPLHDPRLCLCPPSKPEQCQSLLPLLRRSPGP